MIVAGSTPESSLRLEDRPSRARSPWVAIDVATDPVAHARLLRRAHERELVGGSPSCGQLRELVLDSWQRCLAAGVAPDQAGAPVRLSTDELEAARERSPLAPAIGAIHLTLSSFDEDARHIVAIGDAGANLLWVTGDREHVRARPRDAL